MTKTILRYGLIGGAIVSLLMAGTIYMMRNNMDDFGALNMAYGFGTMILAFSTIFLAIRSYRNANGGTVSFGQSFWIGIGITFIASTFYVATWLIYVSTAGKGFEAKYAAAYDAKMVKDSSATIDKMIADGKPAADIEKKQKAISTERAANAKMMDMYANNIFVKAGITYTEILPVGLIMTLVFAIAFLFVKKP